MGRSFANMHIKSGNLEHIIEVLRELAHKAPNVLGLDDLRDESEAGESMAESNIYVNQNNEYWVSVLHSYFVWGTVKEAGKELSKLTIEPIVTIGFMHDELLELSILKDGQVAAERTFCEEWVREEYGLPEGQLNDRYLSEGLGLSEEQLAELLSLTNPASVADLLTAWLGVSIWSDSEWLPYEKDLGGKFKKYDLCKERLD